MDQQQVREVAEDALRQLHLPGLLIAATNRAQVAFYHSAGCANFDDRCAISPNHLFPIGSLTKSFAAASVLVLRDSGALSLQQSPADFVPELSSKPFFREISLYQLLSMQSGLAEDCAGSWAEQHLTLSNSEISQAFAQDPILLSSSSRQFLYSNFGYMILGRVISAASAIDARSFIQEHFLNRLGLSSTSWEAPSENFVTGYKKVGTEFIREARFSANNDAAVFGGLWSSVTDVARWIDFLAAAHDETSSPYDQILSKSSRLEMQRAVILCPLPSSTDTDKTASPRGYGMGLCNYSHASEWAVGHGGAVPGFGCHMRWSPSAQRGVIALANLRYADLGAACEKALAAVIANAPAQTLAVHPLVERRAAELMALIADLSSS